MECQLYTVAVAALIIENLNFASEVKHKKNTQKLNQRNLYELTVTRQPFGAFQFEPEFPLTYEMCIDVAVLNICLSSFSV